MPQRLGNSSNNLYWVLGNAERKCMDLLAQLRCERFHAEAFECPAERIREAVNPVSVCFNRLALDFIQPFPNLLSRELSMIEERDEIGDRTFEVDVVLPKRVIGIDEQRLRCSVLGSAWHEVTEVVAEAECVNFKSRLVASCWVVCDARRWLLDPHRLREEVTSSQSETPLVSAATTLGLLP